MHNIIKDNVSPFLRKELPGVGGISQVFLSSIADISKLCAILLFLLLFGSSRTISSGLVNACHLEIVFALFYRCFIAHIDNRNNR